MLSIKITDYNVNGGSNECLKSVTRYGARGILLDQNKKIALMYMEKLGLYKLPGGGLEKGENTHTVFIREIKEETGFDAEIMEELGTVEEHKLQNNFLQLSYCFIAQKLPSTQLQNLSDSEKELGLGLMWFEIDEAIKLLKESFIKCDDYTMKFMMLRDTAIVEYARPMLT